MKLRFHFIWPLLLASAAPCFAAGPEYDVTVIPLPSGGSQGAAYGVSAAGVGGQSFIGDWNQADGIQEPSLWQGGQSSLLPVPQGDGGGVTAINATGMAVGGVTPGPLPAAWSGGQLELLDTAGFSGGYATGVNDSGVISGTLNNGDGTTVPATWTNGTATSLGLPQGATSATGLAVNGAGQVLVLATGSVTNSTWIWSQGTYTAVPNIEGSLTGGTAMNNLGEVVGYTELPGQSTGSGFLYSGGTISVLTGLAGDVFTTPNSINDAGIIVGYGDGGASGSHAMLWENGQVYNLNTLIPAGSGWTLEAAYSVDAGGDIVGVGDFDGELQGFELTPDASPSEVPEPASLGVLALGAFALLSRRRRANRA